MRIRQRRGRQGAPVQSERFPADAVGGLGPDILIIWQDYGGSGRA